MATFNELAKDYAERIRRAIRTDNFQTLRSLSPNDLIQSNTLREAKAVKRDIDSLVYTESNKPLSEQDKNRLVQDVDQELGLPRRTQKSLVESASNDDLADLADEIENVLRGK